MQEMPWMRLDFDIRRVIAADSSGAFEASLERALDELASRLESQSFMCRDPAIRHHIEALLSACETSHTVVHAAYGAARTA